MSYSAQETSLFFGAPVELFLFKDSTGQDVMAYTTGEDALLDGLTEYLPGIITRSAIRQTNDDPTGSIQIKVPVESPLAERFRVYLPAKPISLTVFRYHETDVGAERRVIFIGQVVSVQFEADGLATINCEPITKAKGKKVPWQVYKKGCNWALFEHGCGVSRAAFSVNVTSYTQTGNLLVTAQVADKPDGWYRGGYIEVVATGERRFILNHVGSQLTLDYPFFGLPEGQVLKAFAGCDRTAATCRAKFNNLPNYLGFDYIPTENPYDTNFGPSGPPADPGVTIPLPYFGQVTLGGG